MPPVTTPRPPAGGWRGLDPRVVVQMAQLLKAARLIERADSRIGRELLAAWAAVDPEHPDTAAYVRMVAELEPGEIDYEEAFRSLLGDGE